MAVAYFSLTETFVVSVWLETLLYGIFLPIFCASIYVITYKKRCMDKINRPMLASAVLMFALATAHIGIVTWRMIYGFAYLPLSGGNPGDFFADLKQPTQSAKDAIYATQSLLGDGFNIYRAWLVWNRNIWVVVGPIILWIVSVFAGYYTPLYLFTQADAEGETVFVHKYKTWAIVFYVLALAQNIATTSLISYRLWSQEQQSSAYRASRFSFMPIAYIVLESAAFYVVAQLVLLILLVIDDNGQYIVVDSITPIVGIVFCLIIGRVGLHSYNLSMGLLSSSA